MTKKVIIALFLLLGGSLGGSYLPFLWEVLGWYNIFTNSSFMNIMVGAIIFLLLSFILMNTILNLIHRLEKKVTQMSVSYLIFGLIGAILGLLAAGLASIPFSSLAIPAVSQSVPFALSILLGYLGFYIGTTRVDEFRKLFNLNRKKSEEPNVLERKADESFRKYKLLDTSVIIDGRIYDIAKTGFIDGILVIPNFVLLELQYIADSSDSLKRVRGRRGLDILNALQKEDNIRVESYDGDYDDIQEVDRKLIRLAKALDAVIVTNDYNLNKVSEFQNVPVLNINALANAVKPVVIPGETMRIQVIKAGTERQQGVAYLDDGTMIVVEDGQYYMNEEIDVVVTSALQTAAGRMIFAKPVHSQRKLREKG